MPGAFDILLRAAYNDMGIHLTTAVRDRGVTMPVESVYVLLAIVLAVIGDIWLMRWWRRLRLKTDTSSG